MTSVKSFGPFNRRVGSTRRFPVVVREPKIRVGPGRRNRSFFPLAESHADTPRRSRPDRGVGRVHLHPEGRLGRDRAPPRRRGHALRPVVGAQAPGRSDALSPAEPTPRETSGLLLLGVLFLALLFGVRDVLTPPIVFLLFAWAAWPHRARTEIRSALFVAAALILLWFLGEYGSLLTPFIVSVGAAYVIAPLV